MYNYVCDVSVCVELQSLANMRTKPATHLIQIESKLAWNMKGEEGKREREGRLHMLTYFTRELTNHARNIDEQKEIQIVVNKLIFFLF